MARMFFWVRFVRIGAVLCGSTEAESGDAGHEGEALVDPAGGRGGGDRSG